MKVLIVGPSSVKSKGGMATVIRELEEDVELCNKYHVDSYASYIDGNKFVVLLYSVFSFLRFYFTRRSYDIYHIHVASRGSTIRKSYYVKAAKSWKKKVVLHIHGAQYLKFYDEINDKKKKQVVDMLKNADKVVALSNDWKQKFDTIFGLTNCVVIENGINMVKLAPAITSIEQNQKTFLVLGRLGQRKGTYDLVEAVELAVKKVPNIKLYLAGDGEIAKVRRLVDNKDLNKNIEIIGWVNFEKKLELLKQVSTVVLPSYNEGLPMSVLEGMACGKGIVSTTVGAIPEVVQPENGILIHPGDIESLSEALIRLCTDKRYLYDISSNNIEKIQRLYSLEVMHQNIEKLYNSLI